MGLLPQSTGEITQTRGACAASEPRAEVSNEGEENSPSETDKGEGTSLPIVAGDRTIRSDN
jgi:hypothetical protein